MSAHEQRLQQQVEHFLAAGGRVQVLPGFQGIAPLPPRRYTAAKAPSNRSRGLPEYRQLLSMRDELRELGINHSAQEVSAMKGIAAQTLRDFARDHGFTFRSIAARRFTPTEIASIKAIAQRMNVTQASREIGIGRKVLQRLAKFAVVLNPGTLFQRVDTYCSTRQSAEEWARDTREPGLDVDVMRVLPSGELTTDL